jgi:hypothetical protein
LPYQQEEGVIMPTAKYQTFRNYAGFLVRGEARVQPPPKDDTHLHAAFYVLSQVEAAFWGTVQSYDGAGISAGPLHAIAFSPASKTQGALWKLIAQIFAACPETTNHNVDKLRTWFKANGMTLTLGGVLVNSKDAKPVTGESIRAFVSAPQGLVPAEGPVFDRALTIALLFNDVFSDPATFQAQTNFTIQWLLQGNRDAEFAAYAKYSKTTITKVNAEHYLSFAKQLDLGSPLDLAMCVYHAFSVNAPSPAANELDKAMAEKDSEKFARRLIRGLGSRNYARWHDTTDNSSRYDHVRMACAVSDRWLPTMLAEMMPVNL